MDVREFTVAEDAGIGVVTSEIFQQLVEGVLLGLGAGVGWMALLIKASLIDNAKGAPVVAFDMMPWTDSGKSGMMSPLCRTYQ